MLTRMRLENFKSWEDTGEINLRPITGFFGPNSSGKSSLFQALLLMKQTVESPDRGLVLHFGDQRTLVDLGDFESIIHRHETQRTLKFSLGWKSKSEFSIPISYGNGDVAEGDDLGFEIAIAEKSSGPRRFLIPEKMSYNLDDGRKFGVRIVQLGLIDDGFQRPMKYEIHLGGSTFDSYYSFRKFHDFPYFPRNSPRIEELTFDLSYGLTMLFEGIHYLGPLRANPHRIYAWSGAQPIDTGSSGELTVDALLSSWKTREMRVGETVERVDIGRWVGRCLKKLGLIQHFGVDPVAEGRRIFEVKVKKSQDSAEVILADVGFGISQILPVLVLCFYVPSNSTVLLDHPDIHLHPFAQAALADVFIDAWKGGDVQILFESHSEHMLRRLQRRIAEGEIKKEDVALYFCSTDSDGTSILSRLEVDKFGNIANWPKDFFGDQFGEIAAMTDAALARQENSP